ncbi:MAG: hypothetical protein AB7O62_05515 [Pirellulales bacterium]
MGDAFRKVQPNEPLRVQADTFNSFVDAARAEHNRQHDREAQAQATFRQNGVVLVRNETGGDRDRFDVVGLDQPIIGPDDNLDEFKNRAAFNGVMPQFPYHAGRYAVLLEPLAEGKIGHGLVSGICVARVDVLDADHRAAEISEGETQNLRSQISGSAQILWVGGELGVQWAVVRIGNEPDIELLRFELSEDLELGDEAEARLLKGTGLAWSPDDYPVTVCDWYTQPGMWQGYTGYRGFCVKRFDGDDRYDVIWMETPARSVNFTLTQSLLSGQADATVDKYYLQGKNPLRGEATTFKVYDPQKLWRRALVGAKGLARWNDRDRRYEVVHCNQQTILCRAQLREKMGSDEGVGQITQVFALTFPPFGQQPNPIPLTAINRYHLAGRIGDQLLIAWDEGAQDWIIAQVQHQKLSVITQIRLRHVDSGSSGSSGGGGGDGEYDECVLEVKRRDLVVMVDGDETDWQPIYCLPTPSGGE